MLCKIKFTVNAGLSKKIVVIVFLAKVFAGVFNGWLSYPYPNADTWLYHSDALREYYLLFSHPKEYFTNLFISNYGDNYSGFFSSVNSFWNDMKTNLMVKIISVFHVFSLGNYYVNVVLYNFLTFFGFIALFRVFDSVYKNQRSLLTIGCFLLPSVLFFCSSIHKEGLIISALGILMYCIHGVLHCNGLTFKRVVLILLSVSFIFLLRNFVVLALLPAVFAWMISAKGKYKPLLAFSIVYVIGIGVFFLAGKISPNLNMPAIVVEKQQAFHQLGKANSTIPLAELSPTFSSFAKNAPQAFVNSLFRPFITDGKLLGFLYPLAVELLFYEFIFILMLIFPKTGIGRFNNPFIVFGVFFAFSLLLIIGYSTPVLGAIVRYRSIYLPFIILPLLCNINYKKISSVLSIKK
ncbi:hypothetical protein ACQ33O_07445 [Ferruginibacter sp. SUN002]|uniref:hypothetical protein n=1 Tax=Ferruginibacter sp. SUN002 TaxID=2937789 RepID=UPI003D3642C8